MFDLIVKKIKDFVVWFFLGGIAFAATLPLQVPEHLQLKTDKVNLVGNKSITVFDLDEYGMSIEGTGKPAIKYAYKDKKLKVKDNEIVSKRTKHSRTFRIDNDTYKTEIIAGVPQYYEENGEWYQVEYATTTPEAYTKQTVSVKDKIFALVGIEKVWATTSTFYPDADPESTSVDGWARNINISTWASAWGASTGNGAGDSDVNIGILAKSVGTDNDIVRAFFLFDTSSIGDTDTIDSAVLSLFGDSGYAIENDDSSDIDISAATPASNTAITTSDYDYNNFGTVFSSVALSTLSNSAYNDFTLDANGEAYISKTGITKFGARNSRDTDNNQPTGTNNFVVFMADKTGTANDPKLVVVHTSPAVETTGEEYIILFE